MSEDDKLLMAEINAAADKAENERPKEADIDLFANFLAGTFEHRSEEDILDMVKTVWRTRGLFWLTH